ncbi:MAG: heme exporter protein CcmB, partial [Alphaproteobacteria bacterium]|nr:heme exporter protein CcmB [Alphaproteobacteria bacterium]
MSAFWAVLGRDLRLGLRHGSDAAMVLAFFVLAAVLFPFGVGPEANLLARISAGVVWVTALLAAMLSLDRLFQTDYEDGSLDQLALSRAPLPVIVLAKAAAHWLTTGLPLIAVAPALGLMLRLDPAGFAPLIAAMLIGTPCLSLVGAIGAALALGARRGGALVALLVLPLVLPVLIFGVGAVEAEVTGLGAQPHLMILGALLAAALPLAP